MQINGPDYIFDQVHIPQSNSNFVFEYWPSDQNPGQTGQRWNARRSDNIRAKEIERCGSKLEIWVTLRKSGSPSKEIPQLSQRLHPVQTFLLFIQRISFVQLQPFHPIFFSGPLGIELSDNFSLGRVEVGAESSSQWPITRRKEMNWRRRRRKS